jgi:type IV pilus assembly protein PilB
MQELKIMTAQFKKEDKTLAEILLDQDVLNQQLYDKVKLESLNTGKSQEEIIEEEGLVSDVEMAKAKAELYDISFVNLNETSISPEALNFVPEVVSRRYNCFPYGLEDKRNAIRMAMEDPFDVVAIEFLEQKTGKNIIPAIAAKKDIERAINRNYSQSLSSEVTEALKETESGSQKKQVVDKNNMGKIIKEAPIAKIVSTLLDFAMKAGASDIHIEPEEDRTRVRYRIDGILHEKLVLPKGVHDAAVSRIKILGDMKIDEKRVPQDGRFSYRSEGSEVDLRVSSLPTVNGEKIVMRLLKQTEKIPTLPELGLRGKALKDIRDALGVSHGIILVTGPTGSGKTTTLYSSLTKLNTNEVNITTLEDPVEYEIQGANQVQVNQQAGLTFSSGLRSFLRQDPDIIMVGEIRDEETAALAVHAALTGHVVFSTLHTNSAAGGVPRLMDMEAEPYLLASSMVTVVGQRVVRRVCEHCKKEYKPDKDVIEDIKQTLGPLYPKDKEILLTKGEKCPKCNETGYSGRVGIFEVLPVTDKIRKLILEQAPSEEIEKQAREDGMVTMIQDGYLKSLEGITTIEEVLRVSRG